MPAKQSLSVPEQHQKNIAIKTLKMPDAMVGVMGGMNKDEAREFLKSIGYTDAQVRKLEARQASSRAVIASELVKLAGKILGPGIPDGTGPARGSGFCPFDEQEEAVVRSEIARTAQHLLNVKTLEPLTDRETTRAIRDAIIAEEDAIKQYETVADSTDNAQVKEVLQDIADEEKVHVGELQKLLILMLPDEQGFLDEGAEEVDGEPK